MGVGNCHASLYMLPNIISAIQYHTVAKQRLSYILFNGLLQKVTN